MRDRVCLCVAERAHSPFPKNRTKRESEREQEEDVCISVDGDQKHYHQWWLAAAAAAMMTFGTYTIIPNSEQDRINWRAVTVLSTKLIRTNEYTRKRPLLLLLL